MRWAVPCFFAASFAATGCGGSSASAPPQRARAIDGAYADLAIDAPLDDGESAALLLAASDAIAHEGNVGAARGQSGDVQAFAQQTVTDATRSSDRESAVLAGAGIALEDCAASTRLLQADLATLAMLQSAPDAAFDRAFVDARLAATTKVLAAVDGAVLPSARSPDFLAFARGVRGMLADELAALETLRSELTQAPP